MSRLPGWRPCKGTRVRRNHDVGIISHRNGQNRACQCFFDKGREDERPSSLLWVSIVRGVDDPPLGDIPKVVQAGQDNPEVPPALLGRGLNEPVHILEEDKRDWRPPCDIIGQDALRCATREHLSCPRSHVRSRWRQSNPGRETRPQGGWLYGMSSAARPSRCPRSTQMSQWPEMPLIAFEGPLPFLARFPLVGPDDLPSAPAETEVEPADPCEELDRRQLHFRTVNGQHHSITLLLSQCKWLIKVSDCSW